MNAEAMNRRAAWVSFAAVLAYFVAVAERSSLGVAAVLAAERFETNASQLSTLTVLQLAVYAVMQVPVGVLLDRYGSKRLIVAGAVLMGVGQVLVATADVLAQAVVGRAILGMGDAFTFISMIRLINHWYSGAQATKRTQLYANFGQLGQVFSALVFSRLLVALGWSSAYLCIAAFAIVAAILAVALIKDSPQLHDDAGQAPTPWSQVFLQLKQNVANPAVRLAFWIHFSTQSSGAVFVLLWGYGFLTEGEGLAGDLAGLLLASFVVIGFIVGPIMSQLAATRPGWRVRIATGQVIGILVAWSAVLLWQGPAPLVLLILLILVLGSGGPASMLAFDFTRQYVPIRQLGTANGLVNLGGFIAAFTMMYAVGGLLDWAHDQGISPTLFNLAGFKVAMLVQFAVLGIGLALMQMERRRLDAR